MPDLHFETRFSNPAETTAFAVALGQRLHAGDVILLEGDIGAGKTHFARGMIQSLLSEPEDVPSPTFTLVQVYDGPECEIWHADLYRLTDPNEAIELGLEEAFQSAICLVEWPERLATLVPADALTLSFAVQPDDTRIMTAKGTSKWERRLRGLK
ncbi:tRNA (adenosine(37)-N6)-threonylcarbamoyltransferase complex ATPase subunit type 1 TsaE [Thalassovita sp.]|uniref:tRNA (adenosine(37)-N6)-threonylcarbamoyltransferase complex ATPase subunit type 1 TsaE n=1 Tax=Thalassovita sp. TaxID=1979401 RepID=UPI0029DE5AC6|nr:tRNA (adenosine(37)-N6)-threonylcarbamoyltransferase complex ATPase subunit type 1 TsaE [Thalassovita sp.]